jgi:hypothetical protein
MPFRHWFIKAKTNLFLIDLSIKLITKYSLKGLIDLLELLLTDHIH